MAKLRKTKSMRRRYLMCFKTFNSAVEKVYSGRKANTATTEDDGGEEKNLPFLTNGCKREKCRRSLNRVLKVVFFGASLSRKLGSQGYNDEDSSSVKSSSSKNSSKKSNNNEDHYQDIDQSFSSSSSIFSSSPMDSSFSSSCSSTRTCNDENNMKNGCYFSSCNMGLCFLAVLLVLLIWGKAFAVFCTLLYLFLAPPRRLGVIHARSNNVEMLDFDSDEHKKRVIMEGLLHRNRI